MIKKVLIAICPAKLISILKLFAFRLDALIVHIFCCSGMLASFYYVFMNRRFDREHKAVLKGRVQYKRSLTTLGKTSPLLRRNIHRLEKGLVMQPQRDTFAESYILETVENYAKCARIKDFSMGEYKWATDVLVEYFSKVAESDVINQARTVFSGALLSIENTNKSIPYLHETLPGTDVSYAQLKTLFTRRRSVRWYQNRTVEKNKILQAIDAAGLAPSACNRQPFRFEIAYGNQKASTIARYAMGTAGFSDNIQCLLVVVGNLSAYPLERDRHVIYIDASLASMQFMLACETLGLSTCPINWPDIDSNEEMIAKRLKLKDYERPIMLIAVGYADPKGGVPFSQKKSAIDLLKEIE